MDCKIYACEDNAGNVYLTDMIRIWDSTYVIDDRTGPEALEAVASGDTGDWTVPVMDYGSGEPLAGLPVVATWDADRGVVLDVENMGTAARIYFRVQGCEEAA